MVGVAIAGTVAAGIGGSIIQGNAASSAADTQAAASDQAAQLQYQASQQAAAQQQAMWNQIQGNLSPFRTGAGSLYAGPAAIDFAGSLANQLQTSQLPQQTISNLGALVPGIGQEQNWLTGGLVTDQNSVQNQLQGLQATQGSIIQNDLNPLISYNNQLEGQATGLQNQLAGLQPQAQALGNQYTQGMNGLLANQWNPTMQGLAQTPGYKFTLQQGLQAAQNSNAAKGLGVSGAALRGASDYASGLASQTYNQQYQNYLAGQSMNAQLLQGRLAGGIQGLGAQTGLIGQQAGQIAQAGGLAQQQAALGQLEQQNVQGQAGMLGQQASNLANVFANYLAGQGTAANIYGQQLASYLQPQSQAFNQFQTLAGSAQNAAAQQGAYGLQSATNISNALIGGAAAQAQGLVGAANAQAAGQVGFANALTGGLNSIGQGAMAFPLYSTMLGGGNSLTAPMQAAQTANTGIDLSMLQGGAIGGVF